VRVAIEVGVGFTFAFIFRLLSFFASSGHCGNRDKSDTGLSFWFF